MLKIDWQNDYRNFCNKDEKNKDSLNDLIIQGLFLLNSFCVFFTQGWFMRFHIIGFC